MVLHSHELIEIIRDLNNFDKELKIKKCSKCGCLIKTNIDEPMECMKCEDEVK
jgi:ABC-type ATPase with predicted acetyltransferase domain